MNTIDFEKVMRGINFRIDECRKFFLGVKTTAELENITLLQAKQLKEFCVEEEVIMTKIVMVDLYHLIGMGNFTPPQMMRFVYKVQEYLRYRPAVKVIAKHLDSVANLPSLPVHTKFKLLALCNLTLTTGEGLEEFADVDDYSQLKDPIKIVEELSNLPYTLDNHGIAVTVENYNEFINLATQLLKVNLSVTNFIAKAQAGKEYLGVLWHKTDTGVAGTFTSLENHKKFIAHYNKSFV